MQDIFENVKKIPIDPIEECEKMFKNDKLGKEKIFLGDGELKSESLKTHEFESVRNAFYEVSKEEMKMDYLSPEGDKEYTQLAKELCFGSSWRNDHSQIFSMQTIGGTGAVRLAMHFIKRHLPSTIYIPYPSWPMAKLIADEVGLPVQEFEYFDSERQELKFESILNTLKNAEDKSILFMQDSAHNPTGEDPSIDQWKQIIKLVKEKQIRVILDNAFQGFVSGDLDKDNYVVRMFLAEKLQFMVAQSFSKSMGLYAVRAGCLHVVCKSTDDIDRIKSHFEHSARCLWLSPNRHGSSIVKKVLGQKELLEKWKKEIEGVHFRLKESRTILRDRLIKNGAKGNWENLTRHTGMFITLPLNKEQINYLKEKHHLHIVENGRMNISSLDKRGIEKLAEGIQDALNYTKLI